MGRRLGGSWLALVGAALFFVACGASSSREDRSDGDSTGNAGEGGGGGECEPGERQPAGDGCNTCVCDDGGTWACTLIDCECTTGEIRPADDGCNSCVCAEGGWICTNVVCPMPCALGEERMEGCNHCVCGDFGEGPIWSCTADQCCDPGDMRSPDNGCNTCTCDMDGMWQCTDRACEPCEVIGETIDVGDDCNTCRCEVFGWACTTRDCTDIECLDGYADCDADESNGCETNLETSVQNCGACGNYCVVAGGYAACDGGECVIDHCQPGYEDCNDDVNDGCESRVTRGCDNRCEFPSGAPIGGPSLRDCMCPAGTTCVRDSAMFPNEEYCFPLPETCAGFGRCDCLGVCVCPDPTPGICFDQMANGGFIINCNGQM